MAKVILYRNRKRFFQLYFILVILSLGITSILFLNQRKILEETTKEQTKQELVSLSNTFLEEITQLTTDIFLITDLINVHNHYI